jgi:hypothetical protein
LTDTSTAYPRQCQAITRRGEPCRAWAIEGSAFCYMHDPDLAADRKRAQARGGQARHARDLSGATDYEGLTFERAADAVSIVAAAIRDTGRLENSIARNRCLGYLAGVALKALEITELAERMEAIERTLSQRGDR